MKVLTIVVVALLVGGGGTAVAVATVGNVDWDEWHLFGNHHEDYKTNTAGVKFSVIHTDPEYNEEDGMYYAVSKLQAYDKDGQFMLMKPSENRNDLTAIETAEGIVVSIRISNENGNEVWSTCLLPNVHFETKTIRTHEDLSDPAYRAELLQKYDLSEYAELYVRHYRDKGVPDCLILYTWKDGQQVSLDNDFEYKIVTKTVSVAILSENGIYEMQHIDPTEEASLDSIYNAERFFNKIFSEDDMRVAEIVAAA